ncbi:alkaline phosphatase [Pseudoduganella sp. GCM10020061]|uniref:alkaline phosphatase n=1 Tax=Pseudoduganella sp. GCM10020061 TaxID=3317345 RepID=UPI0036293F8E
MKLKTIAAALALAALAGCASAPRQAPLALAQPAPAIQGAAPKNIIFFLGDGMGITTLTAARIYAVGEEGMLPIDQLPESAFVKTYSNNAQVTDSAAAMSALMTGVKVNNNVVGMSTDTSAVYPAKDANGNSQVSACKDGKPVRNLLELAKARGMGTGVVTTTRITDATPAATYAHACHRKMENDIAAQLVPGGAGFNPALGDGVDVLFGGGLQFFTPHAKGGARADNRDLLGELRARGYTVASASADLAQPAARMVGLFAPADMSFDAVRDPAKEPSLKQMTEAAIDVLAKKPSGFFLMVEGGRIDHALHATLGKRALQETVAFNDALKAAIDRMQALDPGLKNTLIVATADHDHTLLLNGYARRTGPTTASEPGVIGIIKSVEDGKPLRDMDGAPFTIIGFGNGENRVAGSRGDAPHLTDAAAAGDEYHQEATVRVKPGRETHGGIDVYLGATGARAETFRGTIENTRVFELIKAAAQW